MPPVNTACSTMTVKRKDGAEVVINAEDFDPKLHTKVQSAEEKAAAKDEADKKAEADKVEAARKKEADAKAEADKKAGRKPPPA